MLKMEGFFVCAIVILCTVNLTWQPTFANKSADSFPHKLSSKLAQGIPESPAGFLRSHQFETIGHPGQNVSDNNDASLSPKRRTPDKADQLLKSEILTRASKFFENSEQSSKFSSSSNASCQNSNSLVELMKIPNVSAINLSHKDMSCWEIINLTGQPELRSILFANCSIRNASKIEIDKNHTLKLLDLSENIFQHFPSLDLLPPVKVLLLGKCGIKSLKNAYLPPKIERLNLTENVIEDVNFTIYSKTLVFLDLSKNRITEISKNTFVGFPYLKYAFLGYNEIGYLPPGTFADNEELLELNLEGNNITSVTYETFEKMKKLQILNLARNPLKKLSSDAFQLMKNLLQLSLTRSIYFSKNSKILFSPNRSLRNFKMNFNNLTEIPVMLTGGIQFLDLSKNNLSLIRREDFLSYPLLRVLNLRNNRIQFIEEDSLGRLEHLLVVYLSRNLLTEVPSLLPESLVVLKLDFNFIAKVEEETFHLPKLVDLSLKSNNISAVQTGAFVGLKSLKVLDISLNVADDFIESSGPKNLKVIYQSARSNFQNENMCDCRVTEIIFPDKNLDLRKKGTAMIEEYRRTFEYDNVRNSNEIDLVRRARRPKILFSSACKMIKFSANEIICEKVDWLIEQIDKLLTQKTFRFDQNYKYVDDREVIRSIESLSTKNYNFSVFDGAKKDICQIALDQAEKYIFKTGGDLAIEDVLKHLYSPVTSHRISKLKGSDKSSISEKESCKNGKLSPRFDKPLPTGFTRGSSRMVRSDPKKMATTKED